MEEAYNIVFYFEIYLEPGFKNSLTRLLLKNENPDWIRDEVLRRLNEKRLFREALDRIHADQKSSPQ